MAPICHEIGNNQYSYINFRQERNFVNENSCGFRAPNKEKVFGNKCLYLSVAPQIDKRLCADEIVTGCNCRNCVCCDMGIVLVWGGGGNIGASGHH